MTTSCSQMTFWGLYEHLIAANLVTEKTGANKKKIGVNFMMQNSLMWQTYNQLLHTFKMDFEKLKP